MTTVLSARQLFTPLERIENAVLVIEDGIVAAVGTREAISIPANARVVDLGDSVIAPGFIDIHVTVAASHDVMEGGDESLAAIERMMAQHGVTSYCPTTVTAPMSETLRALEALGKAIRRASEQAVRCRRGHWAYISRSVPRSRATRSASVASSPACVVGDVQPDVGRSSRGRIRAC